MRPKRIPLRGGGSIPYYPEDEELPIGKGHPTMKCKLCNEVVMDDWGENHLMYGHPEEYATGGSLNWRQYYTKTG